MDTTRPYNQLGRKDSNLGMAGPKPAALPLGDAPIARENKHSIEKMASLSMSVKAFPQ